MPITRVYWNSGGGYDVHAIPGPPPGTPSQPLNELLVVEVDGTGHFANAIPAAAGVTVKFIGEFEGAPSKHGVLVGEVTGRITVAKPRPLIRLHNFLVRAEVRDAAGLFATKPKIRVHVHDKLDGAMAWLTPDPLTIRRNANGQRFSVLALFDDDVIGDISRLPGITWTTSDSSKIDVDPTTGALTAKVNNADGVVITAKLPANWGNVTATAKANARPPWGTVAKATLIPKSAGRQVVADVPNFLFLAEGFGPGEESKFRKLACQVADSLRKDERTSPYKLLKDAINYWMVWIESPDRGCSVLHEVHTYTRGGKLVGAELPLAREPRPPSPPAVPPLWTLDELIHEVGLPIPADAIPDGTGPVLAGAMFLLKLGTWSALYGQKVMNRVDAHLWVRWTHLANRRLIDERNTALGLAAGSRPNYQNPEASRGIGWHPFRTTRAHLDEFLKLIVDEDGGALLGTHWAAAAGKDRNFVVALAAGTRHAGMQTPGELIASSLDSNTEVLLTGVGTHRVKIVPNPVPKTVSLDTTTRVAHECAHGLGLGDEYGEHGSIPAATVAAITAALNLQDAASLLAPPPPPPVVGGLDGSKLKWLWPRIEKAGVLSGAPTGSGGVFEIPVKAGHEQVFKVGDTVHVRARPLRANIVPSDPFIIMPNGVSAGKLKVQAQGPIVMGLTTFPAGSIVYTPVIDPLPVGTGKPLLLVHDKVQAHITSSGQPLNAPANAGTARSCGDEGPDARQSQIAHNLPNGLVLPNGVYRAWVVGAYEGGGEFQCGLYHPAGACLMRARLFRNEEIVVFIPTTPRARFRSHIIVSELVFTFCPVCRYILVDRLDPTKHGEVDKWYVTRYPG